MSNNQPGRGEAVGGEEGDEGNKDQDIENESNRSMQFQNKTERIDHITIDNDSIAFSNKGKLC